MNMKEQPIRRDVTSIKINPEVWKRAKIAAIEGDIGLSELVEQAIEKWIKEQEGLKKK